MKILITGKNSYIGMSFEKWLNQWPDVYQVDTICLINDNWENYDFSQYDVVFHVALEISFIISHLKKYRNLIGSSSSRWH
jgi:nucleoside-diphosphate-sugar epimerase